MARKILGSALAIAFAATMLVIGSRWNRGITERAAGTPITMMPDGVYRLAPEDYHRLVKSLHRPEAVFLPAESRQPATEEGSDVTVSFVGAQVCAECHRSYVESFSATAHARTGSVADQETLSDALTQTVTVRTQSPNFWFEVIPGPDGLYQKLNVERGGRRYIHEERMDLVIGSGKLGQTFLYWEGDALYELPIGYFTESNTWVNSPGYRDGTANFARPIRPGCMHCHATVMQPVAGSVNRFDFDGAVLGVSCERCHGSGREHVEYHRAHPDESRPHAITNPGQLSPSRQIELCSQCHSGAGELLKPAFTYQPGDDLSEFLQLSETGTSGPGSVHSANQRARLSLSRCFQNSPQMTCTTCHDPHAHERGQQGVFSKRCLECHGEQDCGVVRREGATWAERCIDCHMRREEDTETVMETAEGSIAPLLRDHFISIDEAASEGILRGE
jgi:hypothetical protein